MIQVSIDFHRVKITVFLCSYAWVVEKNSSGVKQQNLSWLRMAGRTSDCCFSALFVTLLCVCVLFFFKFSQSQSNLTAVRCVFDRKTMVYFIHWTFTHLYTHTHCSVLAILVHSLGLAFGALRTCGAGHNPPHGRFYDRG